MPRPTLVLVHGSWHRPAHYEPLAKDLESHGYKCRLVTLPSTQTPDTPPASLSDDSAAIRKVVVDELDIQNDVVVISHSYAGAPSNNALENLNVHSRSAAGESTAVTKLIFIAALPMPKGASVLNPGFTTSASTMELTFEPEGFASVAEPGPEHFFCHDLPETEAREWAKKLVCHQSVAAWMEETTYAAYTDILSAYLYCSEDRSMPLAFQQDFVKLGRSVGAKFEFEATVESSHSPFLSKIEETSAFIRRVASA